MYKETHNSYTYMGTCKIELKLIPELN